MAGALHRKQEGRMIAAESATSAATSEVVDEIGRLSPRGFR
jgi:hypothetical protein